MKPETKKWVQGALLIIGVWLVIHYWDRAVDLLSSIFSAAMPLVMGGAIAYIANIIMSFFEKKLFPKCKKPAWLKLRRPVCLVLAFGCVTVILLLLIRLILPELMASIMLLIEKLPPALEKMWLYLEKKLLISENFPEIAKQFENIDVKKAVSDVLNVVFKGFGGAVDLMMAAAGSLLSGVVTLFLGLVFSIYLLSGKENLSSQGKRLMTAYLKPAHVRRVSFMLETLNRSFHNYIVGQCTEAVILGSLCILGMLILRLPYAAMVGALVSVTALIPVAGAYIGAGLGAFMIFTVSPAKALVFLIFLVILQQLEGNLVFPRVVGSSIGLPGLWVLAAVTVFGGLFGVMGMLLGVPLAATVYQIIRHDVKLREEDGEGWWKKTSR